MEEWDGEDRQDLRGEKDGEAEPRALDPRRDGELGEARVEGAALSTGYTALSGLLIRLLGHLKGLKPQICTHFSCTFIDNQG